MAKPGKKVVGLIKLQIQAGQANPAPPIGPALGQRGLNIQEFCKAFNARTEKMDKGMPLPVEIVAYEDKTFTFEVKEPPASALIKQALGLAKGSPTPHTKKVGKLTRAQIESIAKRKMSDLNTSDLDPAVKVIAGSARSMGVEVEES